MGRPTKENSLTSRPSRFAKQNISETKLIDMMRMVNAAIVGFIALEQSGLLTLPRATDESFEVMLDALLAAIKHIKTN